MVRAGVAEPGVRNCESPTSGTPHGLPSVVVGSPNRSDRKTADGAISPRNPKDCSRGQRHNAPIRHVTRGRDHVQPAARQHRNNAEPVPIRFIEGSGTRSDRVRHRSGPTGRSGLDTPIRTVVPSRWIRDSTRLDEALLRTPVRACLALPRSLPTISDPHPFLAGVPR